MSLRKLSTYPAYNGHYHLVAATKYREDFFKTDEMRKRLKEIIQKVVESMKDVEIITCTVTYNHIHVLVKTSRDISTVAGCIFGASSRYMRKEYEELRKSHPTALWGGKSCKAIRDDSHLQRCISYINRHLPDNTKVDNEFT